MSVRVYQLAKELEMSNKEVIEILKGRGLDVKSPSNTIPNIYADSILEEFNKAPFPADTSDTPPPPPPSPAKHTPKEELTPLNENGPTLIKQVDPLAPVKAPIIKSAQDVLSEREAELDKRRAKVIPPQPTLSHTPPTLPNVSSFRTSDTPPPPPSVSLPPRSSNTPPPLPLHPSSSAPKVPPMVNLSNTQPKSPPPFIQRTPSPTPIQVVPEQDRKTLKAKSPIIVRDFAIQMGIKPFKIISELMELSVFASMNQSIEDAIAVKLAEKHGFNLEIQHRGEHQAPKKKEPEPKPDDSKLQEPRPPVVCVLGHVDHGKTTLLDTIRKTNVVSGEAGGITQHIGAYQVEHNKHKITFIDTPGHAAFSKMRERGANVTDIAILVVAADDGFKPQTDEALKFAQRANVPIVVAINKMDSKGANVDRAKQQLQERGLVPEDWGGQTLCTPVSALKGTNIDALLELVLLQAEIMELKANPKCPAEGVVIESQIEVGRGSTATVIVQKGTLQIGDAIVAGSEYCKVRAIVDDKGNKLKSAPPSTPVSLLGWSGAPESGANFQVVKNEREAKTIADERVHKNKLEAADAAKIDAPQDLDKLFAAIANAKQKVLKVIIKGDVHGTVEALKACLEDIKSDKVSLDVIYADVGQISKNDIQNASAASAIIAAFNTKLENGVQALAKHHSVQIISHNIIYELITQVKDAMAELLEPELRENKLGAAEVRQIFDLTKGTIAGCMVTEGMINRDKFARVIRGKKREEVYKGRIVMLKRFKDDASEVRAGYECGVQIGGFNTFQAGDIIECFDINKIRPSL